MKFIFYILEVLKKSAKLMLFFIAAGKQHSFVKSSLEHENNLT